MALGLKTGPFLLKEGTLSAGVITNPELIGVNAVDPRSFFAGAIIGYVKQGSTNIEIPRSYAEFRSGTPSTIVRKDIVQKDLMISGELGQFDGSAIELLKNTNSQLGYPTAGPAAVWDLHHLGPDEPVQATQGIMLETALTDGTEFIVFIYAGRFQTEDNSIALSGTDYAVQPFQVTAFVHPGFAGVADEAQKSYGLMANKTA